MKTNAYKMALIQTPPGSPRLAGIEDISEQDLKKLDEGFPCGKGFPKNIFFKARPKQPKDTKLVDVMRNAHSLLLVSEKFKIFLESIPGALENNEIFEAQIRNAKGGKMGNCYFVIHQLHHLDAIDEKKTVGRKIFDKPTNPYDSIEKLVLNPKKIPPNLQLFRLAKHPTNVVFRADLAEKIIKQGFAEKTSSPGFKGMRFVEIEKYHY